MASLTKQHFVAFANRIAHINDVYARVVAARVVADVCKEYSPAFDENKFYSHISESNKKLYPKKSPYVPQKVIEAKQKTEHTKLHGSTVINPKQKINAL